MEAVLLTIAGAALIVAIRGVEELVSITEDSEKAAKERKALKEINGKNSKRAAD